jgi:hypothetical protein
MLLKQFECIIAIQQIDKYLIYLLVCLFDSLLQSLDLLDQIISIENHYLYKSRCILMVNVLPHQTDIKILHII